MPPNQSWKAPLISSLEAEIDEHLEAIRRIDDADLHEEVLAKIAEVLRVYKQGRRHTFRFTDGRECLLVDMFPAVFVDAFGDEAEPD